MPISSRELEIRVRTGGVSGIIKPRGRKINCYLCLWRVSFSFRGKINFKECKAACSRVAYFLWIPQYSSYNPVHERTADLIYTGAACSPIGI